MNPADRDTVDVGDKRRALILRNLLKGKSGPRNPAYRLARHKLFESKAIIFSDRLNVTPV
jgi:hypothetical protein